MRTIIVYESKTGFTEQYAGWAAESLGCESIPLKNASKEKLAEYDRVIFGGWIMANMISGLAKLREMTLSPAAVFAVGASPAFEEVLGQIREQNQLGEIPFFYFEGGINFDGLGFVQRMMLKTMKKMTEKKKDMTRQEAAIVQLLTGNFDHTDRRQLEEMLMFLRGKDNG